MREHAATFKCPTASCTSIYNGYVKDTQAAGLPVPTCSSATDANGAHVEAYTNAGKYLMASIPGWPDSWDDLLQPGDIIWTYNANNGACDGLHSMLFEGWASGGQAQVVQGTAGLKTRAGSVCLRSSCATMVPLIWIWRPK